MKIVIDIETDGIVNPTKVHCIVAIDIDTGEEYVYRGQQDDSICGGENIKTCGEIRTLLEKATQVVGHNIIDYDLVWLNKLLGISVPDELVLDTLILSRLFKYTLEGGHSLENWGEILKHPKIGLGIKDWTELTDEILQRCINDARLNVKVYKELKKRLVDREDHAFDKAIRLEHQIAYISLRMHIAGFQFDVSSARDLLETLRQRVCSLDKDLLDAFPPKARDDGVITPRLTKNGTISRSNMRWYTGSDWSIFEEGCSFTRIRWEPFNPGSPAQIVDRLNDAGWKPTVKTKSGESWQVNEENLLTLPDTAPPAARNLVRRIMLGSRIRTLEEWLNAYNTETKRIHGRFVGLGTSSHRMAHRAPNMGNVAAAKSIKYKEEYLKNEAIRLGSQMRSFWTVPDDCFLVGTDMDGAHLRIFSHLINDKDLINALVAGRKENGTDPHTINQRKLGEVCRDRDLAKTAVYSFLNGAGAGKFASIFGCDYAKAKHSLERFIGSYPGLVDFKRKIVPAYAKRGFFQGLDGRLVVCTSEHLMLAWMLQNYEAVMMKQANVWWQDELKKSGVEFRQVNFVHDEWQTEVKGGRELAEYVGQVQAKSIQRVGDYFGLKCPMAGNYTIGKNWLETH